MKGVAHHVFHLALAPVAASTAFALLARPLIDRLQGDPTFNGDIQLCLLMCASHL